MCYKCATYSLISIQKRTKSLFDPSFMHNGTDEMTGFYETENISNQWTIGALKVHKYFYLYPFGLYKHRNFLCLLLYQKILRYFDLKLKRNK